MKLSQKSESNRRSPCFLFFLSLMPLSPSFLLPFFLFYFLTPFLFIGLCISILRIILKFGYNFFHDQIHNPSQIITHSS